MTSASTVSLRVDLDKFHQRLDEALQATLTESEIYGEYTKGLAEAQSDVQKPGLSVEDQRARSFFLNQATSYLAGIQLRCLREDKGTRVFTALEGPLSDGDTLHRAITNAINHATDAQGVGFELVRKQGSLSAGTVVMTRAIPPHNLLNLGEPSNCTVYEITWTKP